VRIILAGVAVVVGAASVSKIADALDTPLVGGSVPTRPQDLLAYITLKPGDSLAGQAGPFQVDDPAQVAKLRELSALSFGGAIALAALAYAILIKVLR
jgi:hypothetical protein